MAHTYSHPETGKQISRGSHTSFEKGLYRSIENLILTVGIVFVFAGAVGAQHMTGGLRVVNQPIYVNVYWDSNWDSTMSSIPLGSRASLDLFTSQLVSGSYFDGLNQYGVSGPSFAGSVAFPGNAMFGASSPATVDEEQLRQFALGLRLNPPAGLPNTDHGRTIYNIFLARGSTLVNRSLSPKAFGIISTPQSTTAAYHSCTPVPGSPICMPYTVIFTGNAGGTVCSHGPLLTGSSDVAGLSTFNQLTRSQSHEMVEAATDPDGTTGWRDWTRSNNEIADFGGNPATCFIAGSSADYWSNDAGGTVSGHNDLTPPVISSISRPSRGREFYIEIHGQGFGSPPPDLPTLPATVRTEFLIVKDLTTNVSAGHTATTTNLKILSWRDDQIVIGESDSASMSAQDAISAQVFARVNGQASAVFTLPAVAPQSIVLEPFVSPLEASDVTYFSRGRVIDQFGNGFLSSSILWTLNGDFPETGVVSSDLDGWFRVPVSLKHSGTSRLTVSIRSATTTLSSSQVLQVLPRILWLSPNHYAIGTTRHPITINGFGLNEVTEVHFGSIVGIILGRSAEGTQLTVNPPPGAGIGGNGIGWVDVVARVVRGTTRLESNTTRNDLFAYYQAGVPIMLPGPDGIECSPAFLTAVTWDENGLPVTDPSLAARIRFRTDHGSFSSSGPQQEFTPASLFENQATATLFQGSNPNDTYEPSVGLSGRDDARSSRQVNFNEVMCRAITTSGRLRDLAGRMSIRDMLKVLIVQPTPRDKFANLARPLQVDIETVAVSGRDKNFSQEARVRVRDAKGNPVAGWPVAFFATTGATIRSTPVLTDKDGLARMPVRPTKDGRARILAVVDEYRKVLTTQMKR